MASGTSRARMPDAEMALSRYRPLLADGLREVLRETHAASRPAPATVVLRDDFYAQIEYHLGWRHADLSPAKVHSGKLLRPTLLLLACELAAGRLNLDADERQRLVRRAVPAAVTVELIHNFSLVHDDIEDGDEERRHRPTLWKLWGVPQAINTGDGIFALARGGLWKLAESGVPAAHVVRLAAMTDRTCLELCEGQYLDMSFEGRRDVTVDMYLDMIDRKTGALMACAMEMGALLGAPDEDDPELSAAMARCGRALGLAFQLRDDLLGIWARQEELGKTPAGDLRRKKMSLPVIHALEHAAEDDARALWAIYAEPGPATEPQIAQALGILQRAGARERVRAELREQGALAHTALIKAAGTSSGAAEARELLAELLDFVLEAAEEREADPHGGQSVSGAVGATGKETTR